MMDRREFLQLAATVSTTGSVPLSTAVAAPTLNKLVLVHGRGQGGLNPDVLKTEWLGALQRGATAAGKTVPVGIDVAFPYYGDKLDEFARQFDIPLTADIQARGGAVDDEFLAFQAQFAEEIRQRAGITDAQIDVEFGAAPGQRGPLNWKWVQAILRAIDKNGTGMNQSTLEAFTRDVFLYCTKAGVRDQIDQIVSAKLSEEPTVVVSHSLGTVVAYSVLSRDRRRLKVPLFVTVGSPLAVRAVRDQFRPIGFPNPVGTWYNAFDTRDVVALYPLDANNFPVTPPIVNNSNVKNHTDNRHGIVGYLDDPDVAGKIVSGIAP
jgi:hypothetical protein